MNKCFEPLELATTLDGAIDLIQSNGVDASSVIRIPVHQVDVLIEWLKEAKAELEAEEARTGDIVPAAD